MRNRVVVATLVAAAFVVSAVAVDYRAAPQKWSNNYDRTAMRHVDDGEKHGGKKPKVRKRDLDPDTDMDTDLADLESRVTLLWAKIDEVEAEILRSIPTQEESSA